MPHTLLLADDSVTIRRVIELTFADESVRVVSVSSGRDALSSIESSPPDIILADAGLPEVSGYDIAAFVKSRPNLRHIPVILLAGAFEPLDEARSRRCGSDGVLVKPFEPQAVIARVRELLTQQVAARQQALAAQSAHRDAPQVNAAAPNDPSFDASLDRLDAAFTNTGSQGPSLDESSASDFAADLRQLRSSKQEPGGFDRQEFGDWDLPARTSADPAARFDSLTHEPEAAADMFTAPEPEPVVPPMPPPTSFAPKPAPPVQPPAHASHASMGQVPAAYSQPPVQRAPVPQPPAPQPPAQTAQPQWTSQPPQQVPPPQAPPPVYYQQQPAPPPAPMPLADAFSNLLAAEEGRPHAPIRAAVNASAPGHGPLSEAEMELIVDRVLARLGSGVRGAVIDLAERLVKAEIDRLKALR